MAFSMFKKTYAVIQYKRIVRLRNQLHFAVEKLTSVEGLRLQNAHLRNRKDSNVAQVSTILPAFNRQLRNVLHAVLNCVTLLTPGENPAGTNQARQREYARNLDISVRILAALVENTIKLLKARVGEVVLDQTRAFRPAELFDSVVDGCREAESNQDIDIVRARTFLLQDIDQCVR